MTKIMEDSTEADGFGDTPLNPISSLPTTNHLSALGYYTMGNLTE